MKISQYGELVSLARWIEAACAVQHEKNGCQLGPSEHLSVCSGTVETFPPQMEDLLLHITRQCSHWIWSP